MALPKLAVIVASLGRPDNLRVLLERLAVQTRKPDQVLLSLEKPEDASSYEDIPLSVEVIYGPRGLTRQRNRGLNALQPDIDIVLFCDDDYVPSKYTVEGVLNAFDAFPEINGISGRLLADGARGPGIPPARAVAMVDAEDERLGAAPTPTKIGAMNGLYGCNMAMRMSAIGGQRFDEDIPLYGWLEDTDFTLRATPMQIQTDAFFGVHCAEKVGRESRGAVLGYSQVANAIYIYRKGLISIPRLAGLLLRPILNNHLKLLTPEPWIDRAGRARGNREAIKDLIRGCCHPHRVLSH